ncbi:MBL fold metallo-hydrolase [Acidocella sp.]|uniref:MBL fold metallo-hydrolase n=1 Tax=Acidocella sp. TaxID=50710 RepID=UPI00262C43EC|nr:MBL fold metallo-hydrolase [Acidocella sp.]
MSPHKSGHFNGTHFFNPESAHHAQIRGRSGLLRLIRARLLRDRKSWASWPARIENKPYPPPDPSTPSITWIGHSSFLLCLGTGMNVLTDPVFSERCSPVRFAGPKRVRAPGLSIEALPDIHLILLSHNHYDHMDIASLRLIRHRFPAAHIVTSLGNAAFLKRKRLPGATELDWWETTTLHDAHITATPSKHFAARTLRDRNETLWAGFMLNHHGQKIYFAGDSGYTKFFSEIRHRLGAPDLALLPIGAYAPREMMAAMHINPVEAVQAFQDLSAKRAIGMHFGTFQLTAEAIGAPEQELAVALTDADISPERFFTLDVGETAPL